ncbi:hypothetical protein SCUP515_03974 [Seiridium cupressi]
MYPIIVPSLLVVAFANLAAAAPSSGCGASSDVPALETRITVELAKNTTRSFMYWLPPKYDPETPAPVILSYHGIRQSPAKQANLDWFGDTMYNQNYIAVYPQAVKAPGSDEVMWQGPKQATQDDVTFTMDILDQLEEDFCIDTERIYASGKSEGAGFVGVLACNATSNARFAAYAPVSGAFYPGNNDESTKGCEKPVPIPCEPERCNIPFLEFHGGADFLAPFDGGLQRHECLPDIRDYMSEWAVRDGLSADPVYQYNLTSAATVYKYDEDGLVTFVYDGDTIGHDWPWTVENPDTVRAHSRPASFNATSYIFEWFANYTLASTDGCNSTDSKISVVVHWGY